MSTTMKSHICCPLLCFRANYPPFCILLLGVVSIMPLRFRFVLPWHLIWSSFADLHDPFLKGLASELETTVIASRAPGAIDAYRRAFLRRKSFAASSAEIQAFPAKPEFVAL